MDPFVGTLRQFDDEQHKILVDDMLFELNPVLYQNVRSHFQVGDVVRLLFEKTRVRMVTLAQLREERQ